MTRRYRDRPAGNRVRDVLEWENHGAGSRHPAQSDLGAWISWACNDPQHGLQRAHTALASSLPTPALRITILTNARVCELYPAYDTFVNVIRVVVDSCRATPDHGRQYW